MLLNLWLLQLFPKITSELNPLLPECKTIFWANFDQFSGLDFKF